MNLKKVPNVNEKSADTRLQMDAIEQAGRNEVVCEESADTRLQKDAIIAHQQNKPIMNGDRDDSN